MISIHNKTFNTKKALTEYVRLFLLENRPYIDESRPEEFKFLISLFSRHPNWEEKRGVGVKRFRLIPDRARPHIGTMPMIDRVDGTEIDISWHTAVAAKGWSIERKRKAEMRALIIEQTDRFRSENFTKDQLCKVCNAPLKDQMFHVDHVTPFSKILFEFDSLSLPIVCWQGFHQAWATYQFLCEPCNIRKGDK